MKQLLLFVLLLPAACHGRQSQIDSLKSELFPILWTVLRMQNQEDSVKNHILSDSDYNNYQSFLEKEAQLKKKGKFLIHQISTLANRKADVAFTKSELAKCHYLNERIH
jgi:hypothetical protein